jgi:PAS domain S-box-containing protein
VIKLSEEHLDALRELINIGTGRAVAVLTAITQSEILLQVPTASVLSNTEVQELALQFGSAKLAAVQVGFDGSLCGMAEFAFLPESASRLAIALKKEELNTPCLSAISTGIMGEIGNIVLNEILQSLISVLNQWLTFNVPLYRVDTFDRLVEIGPNDTGRSLIFGKARFVLAGQDVEGHLLINCSDDALATLVAAIDGASVTDSNKNARPEMTQGVDRLDILDHAPVGSCLVKNDWTVLFWNNCLESWTGIPRDKILGKDIRQAFPRLAQPVFANRMEMLYKGGPPAIFSYQLHGYLLTAPLADGSNRKQHVSATAVPSGKTGYNAMLVIEDVTDMVRQISEYSSVWNQAKQEAAHRNEAERALLKALTDILALVKPKAFGRANRMLTMMHHIVETLGLADGWQYDAAATLSQIGCVTLSEELLEKTYAGRELLPEESLKFSTHTEVGRQLVEKLPRLGNVAQMIARQNEPFSQDPRPATNSLDCICLGAHILKAALDFDRLLTQGSKPPDVLDQMSKQPMIYDQTIVNCFRTMEVAPDEVCRKSVRIKDLDLHMVLDEDVHSKTGALLAAQGREVTPAMLVSLRRWSEGVGVAEPFAVLTKSPQNWLFMAGN